MAISLLSLADPQIAVFVNSDAIVLRKVAGDDTLPVSCGSLPAKGFLRRRKRSDADISDIAERIGLKPGDKTGTGANGAVTTY